jgi:hypothetical protein
MRVEDVAEAIRRKTQAIHQDLKKTSNARDDDDDDGWFSCYEDEDDQEEEEGVEAATTFPPTVKPFASSMGSTGAPQQEHVEEGEEEQKVMAWLTANRLGHAREPLRELGVESLEDLALHVEDEDAGQLALRSTIEVCRFRRALQDLRISTEQGGGAVGPTPTPALPLKPHLGSPTSILRFPGSPMDLATPSPSFSQVFKPTKKATPPDKGNPDLNFRTEVIETNNNARSDHGGGEAAHRQLPKEQTNKTISLEGIPWKTFIYPCPPFTTSPLSCPSKSPVFRLPAPLPPPTPTPAVFKPTKEATPPDKGKLNLDFRTEVIKTNNNARSDHGGGEAAHRQLLKEQTNKTISLEGIPWKTFIYPCPPFTTSPLNCPSKSPVFRLPAPLPLPPPTAN